MSIKKPIKYKANPVGAYAKLVLQKDYPPSTGNPVNLLGTMNVSIVNALWSIVTGEKLEIDDPNLKGIVRILNEFLNSVSLSGTSALALLLPRRMNQWPVLDKLSGFKYKFLKILTFLIHRS